MARRGRDDNVPETAINDQGGVPAFPKPPDNRASRYPGEGLIKCICTTKCYRDGLVKPGEVRYFKTVPEHFRAADESAATESTNSARQAAADAEAAKVSAEKAAAARAEAEADNAKVAAEKEAATKAAQEAEAAQKKAEKAA
ncbi:MAG: hypothetical protein LUC93_04755, partial [Planctomycetaceae bacterium]|nr:hypothetical protein [Planctomycetaceae bacterium]